MSLLGEAAIYRCFCNVVFVVVVVVVVVVIAAAGADVVVVAIVVVFFVNVTSGVVVSVEKQKPVDRSCHLHKETSYFVRSLSSVSTNSLT